MSNCSSSLASLAVSSDKSEKPSSADVAASVVAVVGVERAVVDVDVAMSSAFSRSFDLFSERRADADLSGCGFVMSVV